MRRGDGAAFDRVRFPRRLRRRARWNEFVDRHAFRMGRQFRQSWMRPIRSLAFRPCRGCRRSKAIAAARLGERVEAVFICPCRDHFAVIFARGIEVVVVIVEASTSFRASAWPSEHAERDAGSRPSAFTPHHPCNFRQVAVFRLCQAAPMQNRSAPLASRGGRFRRLRTAASASRPEAGVSGGLAAIAAPSSRS